MACVPPYQLQVALLPVKRGEGLAVDFALLPVHAQLLLQRLESLLPLLHADRHKQAACVKICGTQEPERHEPERRDKRYILTPQQGVRGGDGL